MIHTCETKYMKCMALVYGTQDDVMINRRLKPEQNILRLRFDE